MAAGTLQVEAPAWPTWEAPALSNRSSNRLKAPRADTFSRVKGSSTVLEGKGPVVQINTIIWLDLVRCTLEGHCSIINFNLKVKFAIRSHDIASDDLCRTLRKPRQMSPWRCFQ
jgi:hypothetical protein